jgi:hypothetical protein
MYVAIFLVLQAGVLHFFTDKCRNDDDDAVGKSVILMSILVNMKVNN